MACCGGCSGVDDTGEGWPQVEAVPAISESPGGVHVESSFVNGSNIIEYEEVQWRMGRPAVSGQAECQPGTPVSRGGTAEIVEIGEVSEHPPQLVESLITAGGGSKKRHHQDWLPKQASGLLGDRILSTMDFLDQEDDQIGWGLLRRACAWILYGTVGESGTNIFDTCMGCVIIFNVAMMIVETDRTATCESEDSRACVPRWLVMINYVLLGLYVMEVLMRSFVQRLKFFWSRWNLMDLFVVILGLVGMIFLPDPSQASTVNLLRVLRIAKVVRVAKILNRFPTLSNMISGFAGAMQAMMWGLVLILILLTCWSLLAVEIVHPVNRSLPHEDPEGYCAVAFSTVARSTLLFFQTLVAGDSWGACILPIINKEPATYVLFAVALVTVQLGFTNLILAVIVDKAAEARDNQKRLQARRELENGSKAFESWTHTMAEIDLDQSGTICLEELITGYEMLPELQDILTSMSIRKEDLGNLFSLMDTDDSGKLTYSELVEVFKQSHGMDARTYGMMTKLQLQKQIQRAETNLLRAMHGRFEQLANTFDELRGSLAAAAEPPPSTREMPMFWQADVTHMAPPPIASPALGEPQSREFAAAASSARVQASRGGAAALVQQPLLSGASGAAVPDRVVVCDAAPEEVNVNSAMSALLLTSGAPPLRKQPSAAGRHVVQGGGGGGSHDLESRADILAAELRRLRLSVEARFDLITAQMRGDVAPTLPDKDLAVAAPSVAQAEHASLEGPREASSTEERPCRPPGRPASELAGPPGPVGHPGEDLALISGANVVSFRGLQSWI